MRNEADGRLGGSGDAPEGGGGRMLAAGGRRPDGPVSSEGQRMAGRTQENGRSVASCVLLGCRLPMSGVGSHGAMHMPPQTGRAITGPD